MHMLRRTGASPSTTHDTRFARQQRHLSRARLDLVLGTLQHGVELEHFLQVRPGLRAGVLGVLLAIREVQIGGTGELACEW